MKCGESGKGQPINIYLSSAMCKSFLIQREKSGVGKELVGMTPIL